MANRLLLQPLRAARRLLRDVGVDVVPYDPRYHPVARRAQLFRAHGIDLVLDVGANVGQYALGLRDMGYRGRIVSFEPLSSAFAELERLAARDGAWEAVRTAVGERSGRATLNVAANSQSSSLAAMLPAHLAHAPESAYVATEEVAVETLAALWKLHGGGARRPFVKIDAQGFESPILAGSGEALAAAVGVQLELSIVPLYEGDALLPRMLEVLAGHGFTLMALDPAFSDARSGQLLQVDGIFFREAR